MNSKDISPSYLTYKLWGLLCLLLSSVTVSSQVVLNCGGISQRVPKFTNDAIGSFDDLLLVKKGLLKPLNAPGPDFEIRFFKQQFSAGIGVVITCKNGKVKATGYETSFYPGSGVPEGSRFKNIGPVGNDTSASVLVNTIPKKTNIAGQSWNKFLASLISHHLYDLPQEQEIDSLARQTDPGVTVINEEGTVVIELKVGKHHRRMIYGHGYDGSKNPAVMNRKYIFNALSKFLSDN